MVKFGERGISEALLLAVKFQTIQVELERKKFNEMCKPLYAQRNEAIRSAGEFWPTVLRRHPTLGKLLSKKDQKILKHMVSLEVEVLEDGKSHSITFYFSPNSYFEDEKLIKIYCIDEKNNLNIICQPIKWKKGKGTILDDGHDMGGSFFNWFSEAVRDDGQVDEIDEAIKDDLWQDPFRYYKYEVNTMSSSSEEENEEEVNKMSSSSEEKTEEEVIDAMDLSCEEEEVLDHEEVSDIGDGDENSGDTATNADEEN
ncbi:NAP1-related protein 2-like isoform X2 [Carex rostrata]